MDWSQREALSITTTRTEILDAVAELPKRLHFPLNPTHQLPPLLHGPQQLHHRHPHWIVSTHPTMLAHQVRSLKRLQQALQPVLALTHQHRALSPSLASSLETPQHQPPRPQQQQLAPRTPRDTVPTPQRECTTSFFPPASAVRSALIESGLYTPGSRTLRWRGEIRGAMSCCCACTCCSCIVSAFGR